MEATLAERGQVVIPKAIRDQLGLTPGALLTFTVEDGRLVIRKKVDDAISRVRGRFKFATGDSLDEWMRDTRGRAPNDPIEPWEVLRDDIEIPAAIREDHARRRAQWLAVHEEAQAAHARTVEASLVTAEPIDKAVQRLEATKKNGAIRVASSTSKAKSRAKPKATAKR